MGNGLTDLGAEGRRLAARAETINEIGEWVVTFLTNEAIASLKTDNTGWAG